MALLAVARQLAIGVLACALTAASLRPCPCPSAAAMPDRSRECCSAADGIRAACADCCSPARPAAQPREAGVCPGVHAAGLTWFETEPILNGTVALRGAIAAVSPAPPDVVLRI